MYQEQEQTPTTTPPVSPTTTEVPTQGPGADNDQIMGNAPQSRNTSPRSPIDENPSSEEEIERTESTVAPENERPIRSQMLAKLNDYVETFEKIDAVQYSISGQNLLIALKTSRETFLNSQSTLDEFKASCAKAIHTAQGTELAQHSTCMKLLSALAFWISAIATVGIAPAISYLVTGNARFFALPEKEAGKGLNQLNTEVTAVCMNAAG